MITAHSSGVSVSIAMQPTSFTGVVLTCLARYSASAPGFLIETVIETDPYPPNSSGIPAIAAERRYE